MTVPVYFNDTQIEAIRDAAIIAGLNLLKILKEPTAAAIAYGLKNTGAGEMNVLVFHLGGGSCEASLLTISDNIVEIKASDVDLFLGGELFDSRLVDYCASEFFK